MSHECLPLTKLSLQSLTKRQGRVIQQAFVRKSEGKTACKRDVLFCVLPCVSSKRETAFVHKAMGAVRWDCGVL